MSCHAQLWTHADVLAPVRESFATGRPLRWRRVHDLPDFAYFDHAAHTYAGVACSTCHGDVARMALTTQVAPLTMRWCIDCHAELPERYGLPSSLGATDVIGQALIRGLVDHSRVREPRFRGQPCPRATLDRTLAALAGGDEPIAILSGRVTSPTTARMIERLCARRPGSRWFAWEPLAETDALAGTQLALGRPLYGLAQIDRARVVVSLDDDFLADGPGRLAHARALAEARRAPIHAGDPLRPPRDRGFVELAAADLRRAGSSALVLAGQRQPARVHAIAHALNHELGGAGRTIDPQP